MEYVDYKFYKTKYMGNTIPEADFIRLANRASSYLDNIIKVTIPISETIMMATCSIAEAWQLNENGGDIVSQSVGSWSKHYNKASKSDDDRLYEAAKLYLGSAVSKVRWT